MEYIYTVKPWLSGLSLTGHLVIWDRLKKQKELKTARHHETIKNFDYRSVHCVCHSLSFLCHCLSENYSERIESIASVQSGDPLLWKTIRLHPIQRTLGALPHLLPNSDNCYSLISFYICLLLERFSWTRLCITVHEADALFWAGIHTSKLESDFL